MPSYDRALELERRHNVARSVVALADGGPMAAGAAALAFRRRWDSRSRGCDASAAARGDYVAERVRCVILCNVSELADEGASGSEGGGIDDSDDDALLFARVCDGDARLGQVLRLDDDGSDAALHVGREWLMLAEPCSTERGQPLIPAERAEATLFDLGGQLSRRERCQLRDLALCVVCLDANGELACKDAASLSLVATTRWQKNAEVLAEAAVAVNLEAGDHNAALEEEAAGAGDRFHGAAATDE